MKQNCLNSIFIVFLVFASQISIGQTNFLEHSITIEVEQNFSGIKEIFPVDVDSDGDVDIVYSESYLGGVTDFGWLENTNGLGNFIERYSFTNTIPNIAIYSADFDSDNDNDIVISTPDGKIIWYENLDGLGDFGPENIIDSSAGFVKSIHSVDIDNDGDIDILTAVIFDDEINLYKNENGLGSFNKQTISNSAGGAFSVFSGDFDNDGDIDVLSASSNAKKISWYRNNDGLGNNWTDFTIDSTDDQPQSVYAADLNNDGILDVLAAAGNDLFWYRNYGGGNFSNSHTIYNQQAAFTSVIAFDKDGDEKIDVFSASYTDDKIAWYKNEGWCCEDQQVITTSVNQAEIVTSADINLDGRVDLVTADYEAGIIFWYENLDYLGIIENQELRFTLFPNPSKDIVQIKSDFTISQIDLYNILGQLEVSLKDQNVVDVSSLASGLYILKITDLEGLTGFSKILKD